MRSLVFVFLLSGCFENIEPDKPEPTPSGKYTTTRGTDGTYTTVVDASSMADWIYGSFHTGAEMTATDAWDLRFQRFHIAANEGVEVAPIAGVTFAQVSSAPTTGWLTGDAFEQGDGWYEYNPMTHMLTPRPIVWLVRTTMGETIKLELTKYYDDAGSPGFITFHWSPM